MKIREATKKGYAIAENGDSVNLAYPKSETRRGRVGKEISETLTTSCEIGVVVEERFKRQAIETLFENDCEDYDTINAFNKTISKSGVSPTITTRPEGFKTAVLPVINQRIRKLTPKECWRLMGFTDEDYEKAAKVNSERQLYKQAGNSIVKDVLMEIFKQLL